MARQVAAAVESLAMANERIESILVAVDAIRSDAASISPRARANGSTSIASSLSLLRTVNRTAGLDPKAEVAVVRIVLMLLAWPLADETDERRMVESFVSS